MSEVREARRSEIVAVARQLVVEEGLEGLTIGKLEKRLPYTRGVITHHFANRDDIVDAVLDSAVAEIDRATAAEAVRGMPLDDQVRAVLRTKVFGFLDHPEATDILLAFATRGPSDPRSQRIERLVFSRYRSEAGRLFRDHPQVDALAALLVGTVIGLVVQIRLGGEHLGPMRCIETATRSFSAFVLHDSTFQERDAPMP